ncbi:MAG: biotin/lipoyl-binding protein [Comamonadaceae bacterium]|nr:MAG: biotin/lipoyl-binding protein [Comamonadaceae bacterium]
MSPEDDLADDLQLPELREELRIDRGMPLLGGAPSWSIFDPLRHAYFQVGQPELNLLAAWRGGSVGEFRQRYRQQQGREPEQADLKALFYFLTVNSLTRAPLGRSVQQLGQRAAAQKQSWWQWLLHHYLFVRIPLVRPDAFLRRTVGWVSPLFTVQFALAMVAMAVFGLYFVSRQWDAFVHTFSYFFSFEGLLIYGMSLAVTKTLHELGHAYAAARYGCRVPTMGVALLVMVPVLYTDTTDTWKLRSRKQRVLVDGAGVLTELCLASIATFAWAFLPDGAMRSAAFVIATTSWITTLVINLSPFMRFDGYYFLSDVIGVPNLSSRAQAFGQWKLREWLFGLGRPMPEPVTPRAALGFAVFAWLTWAYRLSLFLGIALVVYHFFFKAIGIVLFAVEIAWFVVLPIWHEVQRWWHMRAEIVQRGRGRFTIAIGVLLLVLAFLPLDRHVALPVVLGATREEPVYAPEPAQLTELRVRPGQRVKAGDVLFVLSSPQLDQENREAQIRYGLVQARAARANVDKADRAMTQELLRSVLAERERLQGLQKRRTLLEVKAPFDGRVVDYDTDLRMGQWVTGRQLLARVVDEQGSRDMRGYVEGQHAWRIRAGATGRFVSDDPRSASFKVKLEQLSGISAEEIELAYLQSTHGGPIAVNVTDKGKAVPTQSQNAVLLTPADAGHAGATTQVMRGVVTLDAAGESFVEKVSRQVLRVLARESGL